MIKSLFTFLDKNPVVKSVLGVIVALCFTVAIVGYSLYMYNL